MSSPRQQSAVSPSDEPRPGLLHRLGEWCAGHAVIVIAAWLVALGGVLAAHIDAEGEHSG